MQRWAHQKHQSATNTSNEVHSCLNQALMAIHLSPPLFYKPLSRFLYHYYLFRGSVGFNNHLTTMYTAKSVTGRDQPHTMTPCVRVSRDCPIFSGTPIISWTGKATDFKFCTHIYSLNRNKSPLKLSGKVAVGVVRDSRKFSVHRYRAHRAVIFAIAKLSCYAWFPRWSNLQ